MNEPMTKERIERLRGNAVPGKPTVTMFASEYHAVLDALESLKAVVDQYPKTADNVPVVPDMDLWCWIPPHFGQPKSYILQSGVNMGNGPCVPWTDCYSTESAARAAGEENNAD